MDTTRADHLGCYGHETIQTPNIDRLASQGMLFLQCTSAVPITLPSHSSMMTGTYPFVHGARDNGTFHLHADNVTLAEVLRDAGYATGAEVAADVLNSEYGLAQGFDAYRDQGSPPPDGTVRQRDVPYRLAEEVCDGALGWLRAHAEAPLFLFVHFFDPHDPYDPPARFAMRYADPYVGEIAYVDEQIGRLLAELDGLGLAERTLVVLTSDHGEGRGQHGEDRHASFVYDSTVSVPLILRCPGVVLAGRRSAAQVRLVDIAPTALDIVGLDPLPHAQGASLLPLLSGASDDLHLAAYSESMFPLYIYGCSQLRAWRVDGWKYIHAPRPELYHVTEDHAELHNLAASEPRRVEQMRAALREMIAESPAVVTAGAARADVSDASVESLRSLGYVGSGADVEASAAANELDLFEPRGPDLKDHVDLIGLVGRAVSLAQSKQADAEQVLRACIERAPNPTAGFAWAYAELATRLAARQEYEEAIRLYGEALRRRPDNARLMTGLGKVLAKTGRLDEAITVHEAALRVGPPSAETHTSFGVILAAAGRLDEAVEQYREALRICPTMASAHRLLGKCLVRQGQPAEGLACYQRALDLNPQDRKTRQELAQLLRELEAAGNGGAERFEHMGDAYRALDTPEDAQRCYRRSLTVDPARCSACESLAAALCETGRFGEAIQALRTGLEQVPENVPIMRRLAWCLATVPDERLRNGVEALRLAERASATGDDAESLDVLAAAYAECGRFEDAVEAADRSIDLAGKTGQERLRAAAVARRSLYQSRKPYRQP